MRIVDAHTHVLDAAWLPEGVRRAWARQAALRTLPPRDPEELVDRVMVRQSDGDAELTMRAFDRLGVSACVVPVIDFTVVGVPLGEHMPIRECNAHHEALARRWEGRLVYCAGVDPRHHDARAIAREALAASGCRGLKLYPAAGWQADDERHMWVYDELLEHDGVALVHTSPMGGDPLITPLSRPAALAPVLARRPDLTMVFAHAGFEAWWLEALDIAHGWRGTHLEVSLWQQLAERDYVEFRRRMATLVSRLGAHRIIFASDTMRGTAADPEGEELGRWIDWFSGLAEPFAGAPAVVGREELELMFAGNAERVYGLTAT